MKFIHLADLHIGRRIGNISISEDQNFILSQIIDIIRAENVDAVVIAGDIYDRAIPSEDAVSIFDRFLTEISDIVGSVLIISGNHDSEKRLDYGSHILKKHNIHIAAIPQTSTECVDIDGAKFWLFPYCRPSTARFIFDDSSITTFNDMIQRQIDTCDDMDISDINIAVVHQFITKDGKNPFNIPNGENTAIDSSLFDDFDYVALGHIHSPYNVSDTVRYCGSPLVYTFDDNTEKSVTVIKTEGENITSKIIPLKPLRLMREITGTLDEIIKNGGSDDFISIILTDEDEHINAINKLKSIFPNIIKMRYLNLHSEFLPDNKPTCTDRRKSPVELFDDFFALQTGSHINDGQRKILDEIMEEIAK